MSEIQEQLMWLQGHKELFDVLPVTVVIAWIIASWYLIWKDC